MAEPGAVRWTRGMSTPEPMSGRALPPEAPSAVGAPPAPEPSGLGQTAPPSPDPRPRSVPSLGTYPGRFTPQGGIRPPAPLSPEQLEAMQRQDSKMEIVLVAFAGAVVGSFVWFFPFSLALFITIFSFFMAADSPEVLAMLEAARAGGVIVLLTALLTASGLLPPSRRHRGYWRLRLGLGAGLGVIGAAQLALVIGIM